MYLFSEEEEMYLFLKRRKYTHVTKALSCEKNLTRIEQQRV